ncbi:lipid-A-disaccharide synthase [Aeromonas caviae]|uniref:lipid-A-disaccharide synthase n=1 Tax=Aeromonas caviae TaxID=648 RepID=UPI00227F84F1|nr:lipid-A-disaccharide synthase [Aeromonas caviae]MCY9813987.1 lipid-A-disaccharide synthase [Aeromonas caviae]MDX7736233.1 lipid-A-disaccharide synthase [Aeromonas caviae]
MPDPIRIGIVAGETSGDILAAGLVRELQARYPDAQFEGIAGPRMQALGVKALFEMEELSVMGITEVLGRLPRILQVRRELLRHFIANPPDIFVGVDAPDFNIGVELKLRRAGIKTVHYVSPSVWAWRQGRIHKIKAATDMVLAFLPFEKAFYDRFDAPCRFVGHTMADDIPLVPDQGAVREALGIDPARRWLAVLPGSRTAEVGFMAPVFLEACKHLTVHNPDLGFIVPLVNQKRREQFLAIKAEVAPELDMVLLDGQGREAMIAADVVMLASGTAALEAMLVKKPMVVGYKLKPFSYLLAQWLVKTDYVSLPNLLTDKMLVPELIQHECTPANLVEEVSKLLDHDNSELITTFTRLHEKIRCNADVQAAEAVAALLER